MLVSGLASTGAAQRMPRPLQVGGAAGLTFTTGDNRDFYDLGYAGQLGVRIRLAGFPALRATVVALKLPGKGQSTTTLPGSPTINDLNVLGGHLDVELALMPWPVSTYLVGGAGLFRTGSDLIQFSQPVTITTTDVGLVGGIGVRLGGRLFAEATVVNIFGDNGSARMYPLVAGFWF